MISRGLMLGASVLVARMLGKTGYGELGMIKSTVGMFGVFAGFGLGLTAIKHVAEFRMSDPARAGRIIGISGLFAMVTGGLMALGLFIFAPWLAEHTINAPHLAGVLRIGALILFINALNGAQTGALAGFEAFRTIACVNLFVGLISFPILVGGVYFGGLTGAVWALAINLCFNWLINHVALRKEARQHKVHFTFRGCRSEIPILWAFSLPVVLSGSLVWPVRWVCNALLVNQPGGYREMGIFTAACLFQGIILVICGMAEAPLLAILSNIESNEANLAGKMNMLLSWMTGVIIAMPLLCFPEIVEIILGKDYCGYHFKVTLIIVVFYTCIMAFQQGLVRVLVVNNLVWWRAFSNLMWGVFLFTALLFLVNWGAVGLAASFFIAYALNTFILIYLCYKYRLMKIKKLISPESAIIWSVLVVLVICGLLDVSLYLRAVAFIPSVLLTIFALKIQSNAYRLKKESIDQ